MEINSIHEVKRYFNNHPEAYRSISCGSFYHGGKLDINLSSEYTQLIREAARCNRFASDVIYDINAMNRALETFNPENDLPIVAFGFRKDGVDGNSFIISRLNNEHGGNVNGCYKEYFAIYFMEVVEEEDWKGYFKVETRGYHV